MLDVLGLVHMNGRVYDPVLGRFISADPFIQAPELLASHNRYSYVYNSPLSATDPSGYFLKWVARKIRKEYKRSAIFRAVVGIAAAYFAGGFAAGMYEGYAATAILDGGIAATIGGSVSLTSKIIAGAVGGFSGGLASSGGDLKAAFQGALTGGAFGYVGTFSNPLANYAGHALVGCASGAMNGGGGEGCARGAVSQVISKWVTNNTAGRNWHPAAHFAVATISGGTMSVITGGKFATGAQTAAFGYLFNCVANKCNGTDYGKDKDWFHEYGYSSDSFGHRSDEGAWAAARAQLACGSAPGQAECGIPGKLTESVLWGGNPVTHFMPNSDIMINGTDPAHDLHDGYVVRWVAPDSSGMIRIWTYGIGNNRGFISWALNYVAGRNFRIFDNAAARTYRMTVDPTSH
jgi:RHS repeat-associated protein